MEQTNRVSLEVTAPADELRQELLSVDGVRTVEAEADGDRLQVECQIEPRDGVEAAIARAVAPRWPLHSLGRLEPTLENIFLQYVSEG